MIALSIAVLAICAYRLGIYRSSQKINDQIAAEILRARINALAETPIAEEVARDLGIDLRSIGGN